MKLKTNFESEEINGERIFVSTDSKSLNGMIRANQTAGFILDCLRDNISIEDLSKKVSEKFNVDIDIASKGVLRFVNQLKELRLLDDNK